MPPLSSALNCLILALKHSANALVDQLTKKFRTPLWCSVKVEIIAWKLLNPDLSALSYYFVKASLGYSWRKSSSGNVTGNKLPASPDTGQKESFPAPFKTLGRSVLSLPYSATEGVERIAIPYTSCWVATAVLEILFAAFQMPDFLKTESLSSLSQAPEELSRLLF